MSVTFPVSYSDVPSAKNFTGEEVKGDSIIKRKVVYEEGIYVGYRYYNTFNVSVSFPFGYGLSYTSFDYSDLKLSSKIFKDSVDVTVKVKNIGNFTGKEVVQLYISAPSKKIDKPAMELKHFAKTELLQPGESQNITFTIQAKDLASFYTAESAWMAEAGSYEIKVGASCDDIKLSKPFKLKQDIVVEKVNKALVPQVNINELKSKIN